MGLGGVSVGCGLGEDEGTGLGVRVGRGAGVGGVQALISKAISIKEKANLRMAQLCIARRFFVCMVHNPPYPD